jgi:hypothetical protein
MNIFAAAALYAVARKLDDQYEFQGLQISIENKAGSVRTGVDKRTGKSWETRMRYDYGYIRLTKGVDGDHVDCFIGPNQLARYAYIVHQNNPHTGKFDEDKCFLGFNSATAAKAAYNVHYDEPWKFYGSMDEIPMDEFIKKVLDTKQRPKVIKAKSVHAGGPGSGCHGDNCGRPKGASRTISERVLNPKLLLENTVLVTPDGTAHARGTGHEFRDHESLANELGWGTGNQHPVQQLLNAGGIRIFNGSYSKGGVMQYSAIEFVRPEAVRMVLHSLEKILFTNNIRVDLSDRKGENVETWEGTANSVRSKIRTYFSERDIKAGGPGSGCNPAAGKCGRHAGPKKELLTKAVAIATEWREHLWNRGGMTKLAQLAVKGGPLHEFHPGAITVYRGTETGSKSHFVSGTAWSKAKSVALRYGKNVETLQITEHMPAIDVNKLLRGVPSPSVIDREVFIAPFKSSKAPRR